LTAEKESDNNQKYIYIIMEECGEYDDYTVGVNSVHADGEVAQMICNGLNKCVRNSRRMFKPHYEVVRYQVRNPWEPISKEDFGGM